MPKLMDVFEIIFLMALLVPTYIGSDMNATFYIIYDTHRDDESMS